MLFRSLSDEMISEALSNYNAGVPVVWVQEEPDNMGAWRSLRHRFGDKIVGRFPFFGVSRPAAATPATGSPTSHKLEQEEVILQGLGVK